MALSSKDKQGVALIAVAAVVVVVLVSFKFKSDSAPRADKFGCVGPVTENAVIVLDQSEKVALQTRKEIVSRALLHVENTVKPNARVTVFSVSDVSRQNLAPIFSLCKPRKDGNRLVESARTMEKDYQTKFIEPLTKALNVDAYDSKESPIAQALIDISLTQYLRGERNSLLVFSDMLENVPGKFSMYSSAACGSRATAVMAFRESKKGAQERPTFKNTDIQLNIIPRSNVSKTALSCRDHIWPWFFGDNEGKDARLTPDFLPGG